MAVDTILYNARIATNRVPAFVEAIAITAGTISATGTDEEILRLRGPRTTVIDGNRRTIVPGLNDSHTSSLPLHFSQWPQFNPASLTSFFSNRSR